MKKITLSDKLLGRFAVVKLWPEIKAAEDECIARLKVSAAELGLECIEIYYDGRLIHKPHLTISKQDVDFVLHLHYDTPKLYDAFSFVALWNPIEFYHIWGYPRCSRNLLSHDDFLSCGSSPADDHLRRIIRSSKIHSEPLFNLYHSVSDIFYPPSLGEGKLFYIGINWEVLGGGKSRHQELLKYLDDKNILKIYGPRIFQGVQVWKGYQSYMGEIPFDGTSIMKEIANAGIALVLSSRAHKQSELMSNRLFESIAAGALIICDENRFASKFFGDALLYIDSRCSVEDIGQQILHHISWAQKNREQALNMIAKSQKIFREKFSLNANLRNLYQGLAERKLSLSEINYPSHLKKISVNLYLLMPQYCENILKNHIESILSQEYDNFTPILIIDRMEARTYRNDLEEALKNVKQSIKYLEIDFFNYGINNDIKENVNFGQIITKILENTQQDAVVFVAPNEKLFSNHLQVLVGGLARNPTIGCVATSTIIKHQLNIAPVNHEKIDFRYLDISAPIGYARFIFLVKFLSSDLRLALPYVDRKAMAILIGDNIIHQEAPATVTIETTSSFPKGKWSEEQENELISTFCPNIFKIYTGHEIKLPSLSEPDYIKASQTEFTKIPWIVSQIHALRREGLTNRVIALKRKLTRLTKSYSYKED